MCWFLCYHGCCCMPQCLLWTNWTAAVSEDVACAQHCQWHCQWHHDNHDGNNNDRIWAYAPAVLIRSCSAPGRTCVKLTRFINHTSGNHILHIWFARSVATSTFWKRKETNKHNMSEWSSMALLCSYIEIQCASMTYKYPRTSHTET